jgi:hypothetical protein
MSGDLMTHAAWVLLAAHLLSAAYELWRATARAGVSDYDSVRNFIRQDLSLYLVAGVVVGLLFADAGPAAWLGLGFCVVVFLASVFVYNPKVLLARKPGPVDWFEDLTFTGLHFVAATMLTYHVSGTTLAR